MDSVRCMTTTSKSQPPPSEPLISARSDVAHCVGARRRERSRSCRKRRSDVPASKPAGRRSNARRGGSFGAWERSLQRMTSSLKMDRTAVRLFDPNPRRDETRRDETNTPGVGLTTPGEVPVRLRGETKPPRSTSAVMSRGRLSRRIGVGYLWSQEKGRGWVDLEKGEGSGARGV